MVEMLQGLFLCQFPTMNAGFLVAFNNNCEIKNIKLAFCFDRSDVLIRDQEILENRS